MRVLALRQGCPRLQPLRQRARSTGVSACAWAARTDLTMALADPDAAKAALARRLARFVDPEMMERAREGWR